MPNVAVRISGSAESAVKAFGETAVAADASAKVVSKSSSGMSSAIKKSTSTSGFSLSSFGSSLFNMVPIWGKVGIAAGVVVAGVVTGAIILASKYQEATNKMAAQAGITLTAAKKIGDAFLTTGGQTTFSAQQMMEAFGPVSGQLGLMAGHALTASQSLAFMRSAMALAEATGQSLSTTTASLATVMQAYGIPLKDAGKATDELFNTSRALDVPIGTLTTSMDQLHAKLGPLAPGLGDVSSLLVDLTSHGLTGSRAMLLVSTGMSTLLGGSKPVNAELKTLGLNVFDSTGKFVGMQSVIEQLAPRLAGLTEAQRLHTEQLLFGKTAALALDSTISAGLPGWQKATAAATAHGTASAAADKASSGLSGSMAKVSASLQDVGVKLGNFFLPILTTVMGWVAKAAQAFAYVLPGALNVLGTAFGILGKFLGPAIAFWTTLFKVWIAVIQTVVGVVINVVNAIKGPISSIAGFFKTAFGAIAGIIGGVAAGVTGAVKGIINTVIGVLNFFIGVIDTVIGGMNAVLGQIPTFGAGKIHIGTIGKIPTLDTGGIVTKPTLAFLAMNSRPEAVVPLGSPIPGGGGGQSIVINVVSNDGQAVVNALKRYMYASGPIPITVNRARALGS